MDYTKITVHAARASFVSNRFGQSLTIQVGGPYGNKIKVAFKTGERITFGMLRKAIEAHGFKIDPARGWSALSDSHVALLNRA